MPDLRASRKTGYGEELRRALIFLESAGTFPEPFEKRKRLRERQGTPIPTNVREGPSFEELRDEVGAVTVRPVDSEIGDLDDVGVPEASERHSLPAKALKSGGGRRAGGFQKLDREGLL